MKNKRYLTLLLVALTCTKALAFKQGIHENITDTVLKKNDFHPGSTDEVSDSNYYTDVAEPHVEAAHADNNVLDLASSRLTEKTNEIIAALENCDKRRALDALGEALHTVQDIVSHSNTVDNKHNIDDMFALQNGARFHCDQDNNFAPDGLVTGYFSLSGFLSLKPGVTQCTGMPDGECCHKFLNKDNDSQPNGDNFTAAKTAAEELTQRFLDNLYQKIDQQFSTHAEYYKNMLKKEQSKIYFVIDDTGSMGADIAGVKASVNSLLDSKLASGESPTLGLVTFKDSPSDHGLVCDIERFRSKVNSISVWGGGDCPEASGAAIHTALNQFTVSRGDLYARGGEIALFTDASPRSPALVGAARARAIVQGVKINTFLTGTCSSFRSAESVEQQNTSIDFPIETAPRSLSSIDQFERLSYETGGLSFKVNRREIASVLPIYLELSDLESTTLANRQVTSSAEKPGVEAINVDKTVAGHPLSVIIMKGKNTNFPGVKLLDPTGKDITNDAKVVTRQFSSLIAMSISDTLSGSYQLILSGADSTYPIRAFAKSSFRVNDVKLYQVPEREIRHVELVPLVGQPTIGQTVHAKVRFSQAPRDATLQLVDYTGKLIKRIPLLKEPTHHRRFSAEFIVPEQAFQLHLTGQLDSGGTFTRELPNVISTQPFFLKATPQWSTAEPGEEKIIQVLLTNRSELQHKIELHATSTSGSTLSFAKDHSIGANSTKTIELKVKVPASSTIGNYDELIIEARSKEDANVYNTTVAKILVAENHAPIAVNDQLISPPNEEATISVLLNDRDPDGDTLVIESFQGTSAQGGTVTLAGDSLNYMPPADYLGPDSFSYTINDGRGLSSTAQVLVSVEKALPKCADHQHWEKGRAFVKDSIVYLNGMLYKANWWSYNDDPRLNSSDSPWMFVWQNLSECRE
ncbi:Ig-like domain-containing protein [Pseudoalteromonas luteoviolacea]|uniref:Carbohydrate binding domain protein n=1 Tax=Pseudoalteromonas luteoviolacea (strain 2ta16) TaxID=1353533 RepID=V4HJ83_PSEL2|nr:Ig-like domain-containing protein [Pseudoalteromonas luteoviolacea]ESP90860.1 carbohydrate binding domain protein [Pseudoalteromonas luteoviolacea 2ta16]KZN38382.1 hypothetical protein N483_20715 [Pseudoalteromonas luteoviolacea NCIMB 1944]